MSYLKGKINDKIKEVEQYLNELDVFMPSNFEQYKLNIEKKAACERYFEKIVEALIDLSFIIIKQEGLQLPEEESKSFDLLANEKIISQEISQKLKDAKGMRNILAHEYGIVNDKIVFEAITKELPYDTALFLESVKKHFSNQSLP